MKIIIVCYPTFGGSGVVATELGLELAKKGHEIHFVTYSQPVRLDLLIANVYFHEVNVPEYPLFHYQPYELALSSKVVAIVKKYKIDLLHVHYAIPHAYAGYMAKQILKDAGIQLPMVTTLHGTDITLVGNHPNYKEAVNFSINHSDAVTSVSESLKKDTLELFSIQKDIQVIPNFINLDHLDQDQKYTCIRTNICQPHEKIITHISNFRKVKRIEDVVTIFYQINQKLPSKLLMIGDGPERLAAEKQCRDLNIKNQVIFFGNSNEINNILCQSDLFLLPSETESFGLAALEAMAHSVPIISTNAGGLPEVNIHGVSGYLSDIGNTLEMANNAISILENEDTLHIFKKNALEVAQKFNVHKIVPIYEKLYQSLIS